MTSQSKDYILDLDLLKTSIDSFKKDDYTINIDDSKKDEIRLTITKDNPKKKGVLIIYIKSGGKCSFLIQGSDIYKKYCEDLRDFIINDIRVEGINDCKTFTVKKISKDDFDTIIEFLKEEKYNVEEQKSTDLKINSRFYIKSTRKEQVTITYYKTGTILIQGITTRLMIHIMTIVNEILSDLDILEDQKKFFEFSSKKRIEENLKEHITKNYCYIEGKIETQLKTSLILMNSNINLPDYTAFAFPALRGLEGTLKLKLKVGTSVKNDKIANYFNFDTDTLSCELKNKSLDANLKRELENGYILYYKQRHTLAHFDNTIETTRIIKLDESCDIVNEVLKTINNICTYW